MTPSGLTGSGGTGGGGSALRRVIPIVVALAVVAAVVAALVVSRGEDKTAATTTVPKVSAGDRPVVFPPAVPFSVAKAEGRVDSVQWGPRCDATSGLLALPLFPRAECYAPWSGGDNGGATSTGVTADAIKVVVYLAQANDPVLKIIYSQLGNNATPDQIFQTYQSYVGMFSKYYETYGRRIELVRFDATGNISDSVAATADAESIARDIKPFMVLGGPLLTNAFMDTLAQNKVMCVSCGPSQTADWYEQRSPYVWSLGKTQDQNQILIAEYLGKRLANLPARWAGDPALQTRQRSFGLVTVNSSDASAALQQQFKDLLKNTYNLTFADVENYRLPTDLVTQGRDLITRLKEAGVTSVVLQTDPLAPQTLTRIATEQNYFPEWVITGSVLVDSTGFSRSYDQRQWAHAFGPSNLTARLEPTAAGSLYLHRWYYGEDPPASINATLVVPDVQFLFAGLQAVGTQLTPERVRDVLFGAPAVPSTPINPQVSYGNKGIWPNTDFAAVDDQTEVWWDPAATGLDEINRQGTGMWRYVAKGKRYLPGQWPRSEPPMFDPADTVTVFDQPPPEAAISTGYQPVK